MDSIITKELTKLLESLSIFIFKNSEESMLNMEKIVTNQTLFTFSQIFFFIGVAILGLFGIKKILYFMNGNQGQIKGYWKKNQKHIIRIAILFLICLFPSQILQFTFQFWNDFISEKDIFQQIQQTSENAKGDTIVSMIVSLTSSLSALFIVIVQIIEVVALISILFLSPLILIVSLFKRNLFDAFLKRLMEAVISPITQTLIMYVSFQMIAPNFLSEQSHSPLIQPFFVLSMIGFSFMGAKQMNHLFFVNTDNKVKPITA